jgi:hypothetical protein
LKHEINYELYGLFRGRGRYKMAAPYKVKVNPRMLIWARERAGYEIEDLPQYLDKVSEWETGKDQPTWPQLRKLANKYKCPSAFYLLPKPPINPKKHSKYKIYIKTILSPYLTHKSSVLCLFKVIESIPHTIIEISFKDTVFISRTFVQTYLRQKKKLYNIKNITETQVPYNIENTFLKVLTSQETLKLKYKCVISEEWYKTLDVLCDREFHKELTCACEKAKSEKSYSYEEVFF